MLSYTSQHGTLLLFPKISDTALVNVTPATFFDKLMESNPSAYRSLTRPVVTCIYILMGISRRLTESVHSNVRLQAQDMVKRWETSGEWKTLGSIMKTEPRPAKAPGFNIDLNSPTFQFDDWTFTLPQVDEKFFDQGVLNTACFSRAFAKQNGQHVVAKTVVFAAVGHFVVHYFPDTAAELFINFSDQVHSPNRRPTLENRLNRSAIQKTNLSNKDISAPTMMTTMTFSDSKSSDQTKASAISEGRSLNAPSKVHASKVHVTERLEPKGKVFQDHALSSRTHQPQLPDSKGASRPTKPNVNTTLDTETRPKHPGAHPTEIAVTYAPWKFPAAQSATLVGVTISQFVADLVELNGEKRSCSATGREIVMAFNNYIDINFPESSYDEKVLALRRKCEGDLFTNFHPNLRALEKHRHLMQKESSLSSIPDCSETTALSRLVGEGSHITETTKNQVLRARKHREMKEIDALDVAPGIVRRSGDMEQVIKQKDPQKVGEACGVPSRHQQTLGETKARGGETPGQGGTRSTSGQKNRHRIKRRTTLPLDDTVLQGIDDHENAPRKLQKTLHGQIPCESVAGIGVDHVVQEPVLPDLTKVDDFLSGVGEELDAKAARKIRFSASC